jgi:hypothetical protein
LHDANIEQGSILAKKDPLIGQISFGPSKMDETAIEKQIKHYPKICNFKKTEVTKSNIVVIYML